MAKDAALKPSPEPSAKPARGFPFRLWAYAIAMTAGVGGAGYLAWTQYQQAGRDNDAFVACRDSLTPAQEGRRLASERATACDAELTKVAAQAKANDDQLARMQSNLSATKDELTALRTQRVETEKRMAAIADIQGQFAKMIDTGQLKVAARRGSLVVELPAEVLFPSGSAELSEKGQIAVIEVGVVLKQFPDRRFLVVGHTDNAPLKNSVYQDNWELSTARALTVTRFLAKAGMKADSLVAAGVGEHDPLSGNASAGDRQRNRRIEIQLLPAITELPPLPATLGEAGAAPVPAPP